MQETWTVLRLLDWCRKYFGAAGIDTPRLDAEVLLAHVLSVDRLGLYLRFDQPLAPAELATMRELVRRRGKREPVAYLVGNKEFHGLSFTVNPDVLTPRPETELLVETTLANVSPDAAMRVADVGTGSGCVAVALAAARPGWHLVATDISPGALAVARGNAERHGVAERVEFREGDLLAGAVGPLDAIVSNPPYVATADYRVAMPEVAQYEPAAALDGGVDGLDVIRRLVAAAVSALAAGGWFALECGAGQAAAVAEFIAGTEAFTAIGVFQDLAGIDRVVAARRKER